MLLPALLISAALASPHELHIGASAGALQPLDGPTRFAWAAVPRVSLWPSPSWAVLGELGVIPGLELGDQGFQALEPRLGVGVRPWTQPAVGPRLGAGLALASHSSDQRLNNAPTDLEDRHLQAWAGLGAAWRAAPWLEVRADLRWHQGFGGEDPHRAATGLGVSLGLDLVQPMGGAGPVAPPEHDTTANAAEQGLGIVPADATIWVPHGHCVHTPAADAHRSLEHLDAEQPVVVSAPGYLPAFVPADGLSGLELEPAPPQGALVVVAAPGDLVQVDGVAVSVGADGVALLSVPEGSHRVQITGGGRRSEGSIAVSQGHATWLRPPEAEPYRALFTVGSAELSASERERLGQLSAQRGDYGYVLQGGYSPEGDPDANEALAQARAEVARDVLIEAGVPTDLLDLQPIAVPTLDGDFELQRSCLITPVPGGRP